MQREGKPQFLRAHAGIVKGVAFSPTDRYVFCSGGSDGRVIVYNALQSQLIKSTKIINPTAMKNINAVKFNADGSRILSTTSKRLAVLDAERSEVIHSYDNCAHSGKDRAPLASDPLDPFTAICSCPNGKGLITFDLRKQKPARFAHNIHSSVIKDITFLDQSWPYGESHQGKVVSLSSDGVCKIRTADDRIMDVFDVKHRSNCVTATPNAYSTHPQEGFESIMMIGGECLSEYMPAHRNRKARLYTHGSNEYPISKLKYTSNGYLLYAISSGGQVQRYRRLGRDHELLGGIYSHDDEILDMDISPNDEYIVTASRDGTVGLMCLGAPSFGWTGYMERA